MSNNTTSTVDENAMSLEEKLKAIQEAIAAAQGDTKKEIELLTAIEDPMNSLLCEGCQ